MSWTSQPSSSRKPPISPAVLMLSGIGLAIAIASYRRGNLKAEHLYLFAALIPSIILHEVSHGVVAQWFGDRTAADAGRITLNPLRHVDVFGTLLLPAFLILSGTGLAFGYAKPVPVNTSRMSRNQAMFVGLAGPFTNILIAVAAALVIRSLGLLPETYSNMNLPQGPGVMTTFLVSLGVANVLLAVFNLIPIPPLDGSSVVERFLPRRYLRQYLVFRQYSMFILLGIMLFMSSALSLIFTPALDLWAGLLR